MNVGTALKAWL